MGIKLKGRYDQLVLMVVMNTYQASETILSKKKASLGKINANIHPRKMVSRSE